MNVYDPRSADSLPHSGTFQNDVLMLKGYTGLSELFVPSATLSLNELGDDLRAQLNAALKGTRICVAGRGSLMCIHATTSGLRPEEITCKDDVLAVEDNDLKKLFWLKMLEAGFWGQVRGTIALNLETSDARTRCGLLFLRASPSGWRAWL